MKDKSEDSSSRLILHKDFREKNQQLSLTKPKKKRVKLLTSSVTYNTTYFELFFASIIGNKK
ncbi:hypothetical protein E2R56_19920 [Rhodococcus qingshengii]|nr:hypothetical protein E2R56_19920 [Rhodococcus qingshengii]